MPGLGAFSGALTAGKDPELRYTPSGKAVVNIRCVNSARKKDDATGKWEDDKEKTSWYDVSAWDTFAENIAESVKKGDIIVVTGKLVMREWEDNDGNRRVSPTIQADEVGIGLRFATASARKAERSANAGTAPSKPQGQDPWATAPANDDPPF